MALKDGVYASDHSASVLRTHSWRTATNSIPYLLPRLKPNMKILDVGCGPGSISVDLAKYISDGHLTGVEYTDEPLAHARALAAEQNVTNIEFKIGDIHALPFEDDAFDIVHAHQVLQHIRDPVQGLREMRRVAKPGGLVAVRESAVMTWYPELPELAEWKDVHTRVSEAKGGNPNPGSHIHVWARQAGFAREDITCSTGSWCYSTQEERAWWSDLWAERLTQSSFRGFAVDGGHCKQEDLERMAACWRRWGKDEDAWFSILHGEILCRA
ncbi:ubiE/COQ5 methyltransferase [Bisporella sp. PMI_857]|nr:ubiE/COQ5 methyltransferase [Bisporella sp. PMI_857]